MHLAKPVNSLLGQLEKVLTALTDDQYNELVPILSNTSIGQHMRHVIEFFLELRYGYESGEVNYDQRKRDYLIQTQRTVAIEKLKDISLSLELPDKPLFLTASFPINGIRDVALRSNYDRELLYNLEHTVHHMALIRIGVHAVSTINLPDTFGVAESTVQYMQLCAQ